MASVCIVVCEHLRTHFACLLLVLTVDQGLPPMEPLTRLGAVSAFFHAFANRSMAYRYPHVIGLTLFGDTAKRSCELTELFVNFQAHIDRAVADGRTALYDALDMAADELQGLTMRCVSMRHQLRVSAALALCMCSCVCMCRSVVHSFPTCIKRILCLTDGDDTSSNKTAEAVTRKLQRANIVVDSVMVGPGNMKLKAISVATGGYSFVPNSMHEAQQVFERETVLSLRERKAEDVKPKPLVTTVAELSVYEDLGLYPYVVGAQLCVCICVAACACVALCVALCVCVPVPVPVSVCAHLCKCSWSCLCTTQMGHETRAPSPSGAYATHRACSLLAGCCEGPATCA